MVARVRWASVAALLAAAATAGGCGGGSSETDSSISTTTSNEQTERPATADERRAIKETVRLYLNAVRARDAKRYCSAFTQDQRDFIAQSQSADDCASGQRKAWEAATGQLGADRLKRLYAVYAHAEVMDVRVTGNSANAGLYVPPEAAPLSADSVSLTREGGRWLIDDELGSD
jgi:hypothetical protein